MYLKNILNVKITIGIWLTLSYFYVDTKLEIHFDRLEFINGSDVVEQKTMRIKKYNRSTYVMDGSNEVHVDMDNDYSVCTIKS